MSEKKFQIFISSTYIDLVDERNTITQYILEMGNIPVGMEMFSAADVEQWKIIQKHIEESDYYIVLVAHRYGSQTDEGTSYTEKEYDYAISKGIPVLGFIIDKNAYWDHSKCDNNKDKLENFKTKIQQKMVKFWSNKDDLAGKVALSLGKIFSSSPRPGWIRNLNVSHGESFQVTEEIVRLSKENNEYRDKIKNLEAKLQQTEDDNKLIKELSNIHYKVAFYYKHLSGWQDEIDETLLILFYYLAPELVHEATEEEISKIIAINCCEQDKYPTLRENNPIPTNIRAKILSDLFLHGLITPSLKTSRSKTDNHKYWTLTKRGKNVQMILRKRILTAEQNKKDNLPPKNDTVE
jgi:hypothetical protein